MLSIPALSDIAICERKTTAIMVIAMVSSTRCIVICGPFVYVDLLSNYIVVNGYAMRKGF